MNQYLAVDDDGDAADDDDAAAADGDVVLPIKAALSF